MMKRSSDSSFAEASTLSEQNTSVNTERRSEEEESDSGDDVGPPAPVVSEIPAAQLLETAPPKKRRRVLPHEQTYLANLPSADRYFKSLMHRDIVNSVLVTPYTDFVITTSMDGWVKFWKKTSLAPSEPSTTGAKDGFSTVVEFVKQYRAHLCAIVSCSCSADGTLLATLGADASIKIFDIVNFDLINMFAVTYKARTVAWIHQRGNARSLLCVTDESSPAMRIYDGRSDGSSTDVLAERDHHSSSVVPILTVRNVHKFPVHMVAFNERYNVVISCDLSGFVEYWVPEDPFLPPGSNHVAGIFEYKSGTDLFDFKKRKTVPTTLTVAPDGNSFVIFSVKDRQISVFDFRSGKIRRRYDESLEASQALQSLSSSDVGMRDDNHIDFRLDEMEFGRRIAMERELNASAASGPLSALDNACSASLWNVLFDESSNFITYSSLLGVKTINLVTNKCVTLLGKDESVRFLNIALYQGAPNRRKINSLALAASQNPLLEKQGLVDPTLFATAFKKNRFYMFTRLDPDAVAGDRDVFNEKPTREERTIASAPTRTKPQFSAATLHTTLGDIRISLFRDLVPKTCSNFTGLATKGYYDNVIFHRIIKKFMIQTGDPLGDGTGGESLWGGTFEDEFHPSLDHSRPFVVSMANAGPGTNGSQFFITTVPTPWLDRKHTIFGKVEHGMDVVKQIEDARVDKNDKPRDSIHIVNITLH